MLNMDEIIAELLRQRQCIDEAVLSLIKVKKKRPGRPPKWLSEAREHVLLEMKVPDEKPTKAYNQKRRANAGGLEA